MGVAIGAVILVVLPERFREFEHLRLLFFGGALVLLMIYRPQGLFPRLRMRRILHADKIVALLANARDQLDESARHCTWVSDHASTIFCGSSSSRKISAAFAP